MSAMTLAPELCLPWESSAEDDRRFLRILRSMLFVFGALSVAVPLLTVPELNRTKYEEVTPELVQVILEEKTLPEQVPPKSVEKAPAAPEPPESVSEKPRDQARPVDRLKQARKDAAVSGLLAFQDELSEMRDSVDLNTLNQAKIRRGQESAASTERSIVTSAFPANSGGIKTSALSQDAGGPSLPGRQTTRVQGAIASKTKKSGESEPGKLGGRSDESIRRVMDGNKSAIFAIYNRALRKNPLLRGKLVFQMLIDPSGSVERLTLVSSEFSDPALTSKIMTRIRLIDFGVEDVSSTVVSYSLDFLPYT